MQIKLIAHQLELAHTFGISRESYDFQDTLIVALHLNGYTGYGEATSNPYYNITTANMIHEINAVQPELENYPLSDPEVFHAHLVSLKLSNFAICALDMAYHDLTGRILKQPLYQLWGQTLTSYPKTNYTIGLDNVEKMIAKIKEKPWPIYKVKLGTANDVEIVKNIKGGHQRRFQGRCELCMDSRRKTIEKLL